MKAGWWIGGSVIAGLIIFLLINPATQRQPASRSVIRTDSPHSVQSEPRPEPSVTSNALVIPLSVTHATSAPVPINGFPRIAPEHQAHSAPPMPELAGVDPATVLENARSAIRHFAAVFGSNPVGTNTEITKALNGGNPKQTKFIAEDAGLRIDARGELVDAWGTPFFFHQLSAREMEIHSAGPDRVMWTPDDLVIR